MFLKKELHSNNDYENKPITAGKKQTYDVPDETEEMTKMFMEMKSIVNKNIAKDIQKSLRNKIIFYNNNPKAGRCSGRRLG